MVNVSDSSCTSKSTGFSIYEFKSSGIGPFMELSRVPEEDKVDLYLS